MSANIFLGLGITTRAAPDADPVTDALTAEALGFDFVSSSDHPAGRHPTYENPTLLAWIAARTSRITVVPRVLGVPFRLPAVVAKSIESLDRLSSGRVVLGLGAGYSDEEIRALGGQPGTPRTRVDGLADAVQIMRGVWTRRSFTHQGAVHSVTDLDIEPKPASPIPIWLGTYGNRALAVTGRLADGWIPSLGFAPPQRIPDMRARILDAGQAAGRDPAAMRCVYNVTVRVRPGTPAEDGLVSGSAADVVDQLRAFGQLGFTGFNLVPSGPDEDRQIRVLADDVLPALRAG